MTPGWMQGTLSGDVTCSTLPSENTRKELEDGIQKLSPGLQSEMGLFFSPARPIPSWVLAGMSEPPSLRMTRAPLRKDGSRTPSMPKLRPERGANLLISKPAGMSSTKRRGRKSSGCRGVARSSSPTGSDHAETLGDEDLDRSFGRDRVGDGQVDEQRSLVPREEATERQSDAAKLIGEDAQKQLADVSSRSSWSEGCQSHGDRGVDELLGAGGAVGGEDEEAVHGGDVEVDREVDVDPSALADLVARVELHRQILDSSRKHVEGRAEDKARPLLDVEDAADLKALVDEGSRNDLDGGTGGAEKDLAPPHLFPDKLQQEASRRAPDCSLIGNFELGHAHVEHSGGEAQGRGGRGDVGLVDLQHLLGNDNLAVLSRAGGAGDVEAWGKVDPD
eukprot:768672-Hanusia_phi.AAC.4